LCPLLCSAVVQDFSGGRGFLITLYCFLRFEFLSVSVCVWEKMYASVTDRGYEGSVGGSGAILIPSRFVWRHGGRRVFLTGSFTRYTISTLVALLLLLLTSLICYSIL
jgi:hypothetical protein